MSGLEGETQADLTQSNTKSKPASLKPMWKDAAVLIALVVFSLIIFLNQNPSSVLPRTTMYFDAAHYLETCKRLYETCGGFFAGQFGKAQIDALAFYLMLDGPVLPGAGAIVFALSHEIPSAGFWQYLVGMQCVFQSVCVGFLFLLARGLLRCRSLAAFAALAWATYPSAISSCNSFLTEPMACMLTVGLLYLTSSVYSNNSESNNLDYPKSFVAGVFAALLCLLKPALAPAVILICAIPIATLTYSFIRARFLNKGTNQSTSGRPVNLFLLNNLLRNALLGLGIVLVMTPWLAFGYAARGSIALLPSRRPVYNITTGCNIEGDGWGCYPTHPIAEMYDDNEQPMPVLLALIEHDPGDIINLTLRKVTRLWYLPWNDYRYKILGLNFRLQSIYQLLLVSLGFTGSLLLVAFCFTRRLNKKQKLSVASIAVFIAAHLIYLPFEGIARYGFTAMPLLILAAVFMLQQVAADKRRIMAIVLFALALVSTIIVLKVDLVPFILLAVHDSQTAFWLYAGIKTVSIAALLLAAFNTSTRELKTGKHACKVFAALSVGAVLFSAAVNSAFAISDREMQPWQCTIKPGDSAERTVSIAERAYKQADWALLMVDGDQRAPEAKYSVNGHVLNGTLDSLYQYYTERYELEDWLTQFASLSRKSPESIRKWRAIQVPLEYIKDGVNIISTTSGDGKAATIYGDYARHKQGERQFLPSAAEVSPGKFFNDSEDAFDSRISQITYSPVAASESRFTRSGKTSTKDLSPSAGIQSGDYRLFLVLGYSHEKQKLPEGKLDSSEMNNLAHKPDLTDKEDAERGAGVSRADIAERVQRQNLGTNGTGNYVLSSSNKEPANFSVEISKEVLSGTHLKVCIKGDCSSASNAMFSVAGVVAQSDRFIASVLPGTPQLINSAPNRKSFEVCSELPSIILSGKNPTIRVELKPLGADIVLSNLHIETEASDKPQLSKHSIKVF